MPESDLDDGQIWSGVLRPSDHRTRVRFDDDTRLDVSGRRWKLEDVQSVDALDDRSGSDVGLLEQEDVIAGRLEVLDDLLLCSKRSSKVALEDSDATNTRSQSWLGSSSPSP